MNESWCKEKDKWSAKRVPVWGPHSKIFGILHAYTVKFGFINIQTHSTSFVVDSTQKTLTSTPISFKSTLRKKVWPRKEYKVLLMKEKCLSLSSNIQKIRILHGYGVKSNFIQIWSHLIYFVMDFTKKPHKSTPIWFKSSHRRKAVAQEGIQSIIH